MQEIEPFVDGLPSEILREYPVRWFQDSCKRANACNRQPPKPEGVEYSVDYFGYPEYFVVGPQEEFSLSDEG